jgi:hypothetical protein
VIQASAEDCNQVLKRATEIAGMGPTPLVVYDTKEDMIHGNTTAPLKLVPRKTYLGISEKPESREGNQVSFSTDVRNVSDRAILVDQVETKSIQHVNNYEISTIYPDPDKTEGVKSIRSWIHRDRDLVKGDDGKMKTVCDCQFSQVIKTQKVNGRFIQNAIYDKTFCGYNGFIPELAHPNKTYPAMPAADSTALDKVIFDNYVEQARRLKDESENEKDPVLLMLTSTPSESLRKVVSSIVDESPQQLAANKSALQKAFTEQLYKSNGKSLKESVISFCTLPNPPKVADGESGAAAATQGTR